MGTNGPRHDSRDNSARNAELPKSTRLLVIIETRLHNNIVVNKNIAEQATIGFCASVASYASQIYELIRMHLVDFSPAKILDARISAYAFRVSVHW